MRRLSRFGTVVALSLSLVVSAAACASKGTTSERSPESTLSELLDSTDWSEETREVFAENTDQGVQYYAVVKASQVSCSPKFRLVPHAGGEADHYTLVAIVREMEHSGTPLKELPAIFRGRGRNLTQERFNQFVSGYREKSEVLRTLCVDRK